ncbi:MAG: TorF family putative porin [Hyphomicrobium sp.]|nr:TorF family putative porin [Hyphomicrobium sp.]
MKSQMTKTVGAAAVALLALSGAASAEDRQFGWSVNVGGTSDYIFRGVSQTDGDPAFQAGVDFTYGILYAGIWGSNTDDAFTNSSAEIDFYAGVKPVLGPVTFDFGILYYYYPGDDFDVADYVEGKAGASISPVKNLSLAANLYYTDEGTFNTGKIFTYEGNAAYTLPSVGIFTPTVSGLLGHSEYDDFSALSYTYWNAGISLAVEKFTFDFRYWDTDIDIISASGENLSDERFVFTAKLALP